MRRYLAATAFSERKSSRPSPRHVLAVIDHVLEREYGLKRQASQCVGSRIPSTSLFRRE